MIKSDILINLGKIKKMNISGKINIKSCTSYLPKKRWFVSDAITNRIYAEKDSIESGYESILFEDHKYPAEMALLSAESCLKRTNFSKENINLISYTSIHRHGHKRFWSPASYLQRSLGCNNAIPYCISQGCNSQLIAIQILISQLLIDDSLHSGLSVSSDRFSNSAFNRWNSDYCIVYGDAASSVLLTKEPGIFSILNINTVSEPVLEEVHRNDQAKPETSKLLVNEHNVKESKKEFLKKYGKTSLSEKTRLALTKLYTMTFDQSDVIPSEVKYYILPNLGKKILEENYYTVFKGAEDKSLWCFGKTVGHLGTSDCMVGLSYLLENNILKSGDIILLLGAGSGFTWSTLLLQIN